MKNKVLGLLMVTLCVIGMSMVAYAAPVTDAHKQCVSNAIRAGAAAHGNASALLDAYNRYFDGERMAALAARSDWGKLNSKQKRQWVEAARSFVMNQVVPSIQKYAGSPIRYLRAVTQGGTVSVVGLVGGNTVTWRLINGQCRFLDVSVSGIGSISDFVRSGMVSKERQSSR